ncbi:hypothetical protein WH47_08247 [Habropoda laboriosa]|uniref:Uncharacterized protein n=1 Tax=Habropoda laboriosa TaxID=597456 RepID=A0A0L7RH11_9HYME|nr:hypothetical protein WH47_08247 [Habropoda laboriosa]
MVWRERLDYPPVASERGEYREVTWTHEEARRGLLSTSGGMERTAGRSADRLPGQVRVDSPIIRVSLEYCDRRVRELYLGHSLEERTGWTIRRSPLREESTGRLPERLRKLGEGCLVLLVVWREWLDYPPDAYQEKCGWTLRSYAYHLNIVTGEYESYTWVTLWRTEQRLDYPPVAYQEKCRWTLEEYESCTWVAPGMERTAGLFAGRLPESRVHEAHVLAEHSMTLTNFFSGTGGGKQDKDESNAGKESEEYEGKIERDREGSLVKECLKERRAGKGNKENLKNRLEHFKKCGFSQEGVDLLWEEGKPAGEILRNREVERRVKSITVDQVRSSQQLEHPTPKHHAPPFKHPYTTEGRVVVLFVEQAFYRGSTRIDVDMELNEKGEGSKPLVKAENLEFLRASQLTYHKPTRAKAYASERAVPLPWVFPRSSGDAYLIQNTPSLRRACLWNHSEESQTKPSWKAGWLAGALKQDDHGGQARERRQEEEAAVEEMVEVEEEEEVAGWEGRKERMQKVERSEASTYVLYVLAVNRYVDVCIVHACRVAFKEVAGI